MKNTTTPKFAFFGTPDIAVIALEEMAHLGYMPDLVVCNPDMPVGRKQIITPPPTKVWAESKGIEVFQPQTLKNRDALTALTASPVDFFVVLAYGKIMPEWLINLPKYGTINAHPSLLPKFRGASPIRSTLLHDLSACGVSIIQMDKDLDHGPILAKRAFDLHNEPVSGLELDTILARMSGELLVEVMEKLPGGLITPTEQDHEAATYCTKITKDMAELSIDPNNLPRGEEAFATYRKICAFAGWPEAFFIYNNKRIKIKSAALTEAGELLPNRVVPEGKKEISWDDFLSGMR